MTADTERAQPRMRRGIDLAVAWFAWLQLVAALVGLAWLAGVRPRVTAAPAALVALAVARSARPRGR